ncbi:hypothetical protein L1049_011856 [Liquidambar formosana]|uniref:Sulfotransferase n=1 Tax=Liquidambar formosana TaxID=63359 RepID=A0AAP0RX95_LIQFO
MTITQPTKNHSMREVEEGEEKLSHECKQLLLSLPKEKGWRTPHLYLYQNFWCQPNEIQTIMTIQQHFQATDTDIILAIIPKSGTTCLKALAFAIVNRKSFLVAKKHPLLASNPHDLEPFLKYKLYANNQLPDLSGLPSRRIFATHIPFASLPESMKMSNSRIVYLCRNPFDTFISSWHFLIKVRPESLGLFLIEEVFEMFCDGVVGFGPFGDHMLGYWKESLESPHKVLLLKYEDMKEDITLHLKRLANFEYLKVLEVNKTGKSIANFENKSLFRKGGVGDWVNHLIPVMVD